MWRGSHYRGATSCWIYHLPRTKRTGCGAPTQSIPRFSDAIAHLPCHQRPRRHRIGEADRHASSRGGIPRHVPARPGRSGIHSDRADSAQAPSSTSRIRIGRSQFPEAAALRIRPGHHTERDRDPWLQRLRRCGLPGRPCPQIRGRRSHSSFSWPHGGENLRPAAIGRYCGGTRSAPRPVAPAPR